MNDRVPAFDPGKLAVVYLRQSTVGQVRDNVIATEEQYKLREIPERLGFPADRIAVIDDDLGVSGHTIAGRKGMLKVLDLLERGLVACVVVRDIARLTRDEFNADIGLIARACYQSGAKIITPEKTYDPADPSDQLLLGFQGLLAGWDRAQIVRRLDHHRRARQARGVNINGAVPPGYEKITDVPKASRDYGRLRITGNPEVRDCIALVLRKGLELRGVLAVVRFLRQHDLRIPVIRGEEQRTVTGADGKTRVIGVGRRRVQWVDARREHVTRVLKNPTYAGAIVNGRVQKRIDRTTGKRSWLTMRTYEDCTVIRNAHEAYITWEEHHELLAAIARNQVAKTYAGGQALLSGLGVLRCGVCGLPMSVYYGASQRRSRGRLYRNTPYTYVCTGRRPDGRHAYCQKPAGPQIDAAATALVHFALGELDLDGLRDAMRDRRRRAQEHERLQVQRVEALTRRAQMLEDAIADATRPEARTRLVARFEEALAELQAAKAPARPAEPEAPTLSSEALARLEVLRDPAEAWRRFTVKSRKEIVRALAASVTIHPDRDGYFVVMAWEGGGRAAAKVRTARRRKCYTVPDEVLGLFDAPLDGEVVMGRVGTRLARQCRPGPIRTYRACGRARR